MKIFVQPGYNGREVIANYAVKCIYITNNPDDIFDGAVSSVEYFYEKLVNVLLRNTSNPEHSQQQRERITKPDYYPEFLEKYFNRKCTLIPSGSTFSLNTEYDCFVKPADRYKRFPCTFNPSGQVVQYEPPYYLLEPVTFVNEWRLYVIDGEVIEIGWYLGKDEDKLFPFELPKFPENYCGAVDMGELDNGSLELVEAHHPYAIGWYGDNHENYVKFLVGGWKYLRQIVK